ncbi:MAG: archease [Candidatus Omnitrophica bacterium]|nr:archease [Candidatus Omnitrophota bacterium]
MGFRYLEEISTSDVAFSAWGKTKQELFLAAAEATLFLMLDNPEAVKEKESIDINLENDNLEMLLFDYLQELIFYKDAKQLLLKSTKPKIKETDQGFLLKSKLKGERLDPQRHHLNADIKAVTLHQFKIEKNKDNWKATVVLDV